MAGRVGNWTPEQDDELRGFIEQFSGPNHMKWDVLMESEEFKTTSIK
jgi:hypothetical protein